MGSNIERLFCIRNFPDPVRASNSLSRCYFSACAGLIAFQRKGQQEHNSGSDA
jgi:hypothetical protein